MAAPHPWPHPTRVLSVDQCSDDYVLALAPHADVVGVSPHALDADSWSRGAARGVPVRRPTAETILAASPDVVVRYWNADPRLDALLRRRGIAVIELADAHDFRGVAADVRKVALALHASAKGERLIAEMDAKLKSSRGAWGGRRALYLTPGGFTAGSDTLVSAVMQAAGLTNVVTSQGYGPVSLEKLALHPPDLVVLGFFDEKNGGRWDVGRRPLVRRIVQGRTAASLPAELLGCPAWFAADATLRLAQAARR